MEMEKALYSTVLPISHSQCLSDVGLGRLFVSASATLCVPAHLTSLTTPSRHARSTSAHQCDR
eukprot:2240625-Rhodomonas_salina.2